MPKKQAKPMAQVKQSDISMLQLMFPDFEEGVIRMVLEENKGDMDKTFTDLENLVESYAIDEPLSSKQEYDAAFDEKYENESHEQFLAGKFSQNIKDAKAGNVQAMMDIGISYENGWGVKKDIKKAVEYFKMAADAGHRGALLVLQNIKFDHAVNVEVEVSLPKVVDVSHLSKSGCDTSGTEAAVVAEIQEVPNISRAQSTELIRSPIVQHYLEMHGHLSRAEFLTARELLNAIYLQIKKIISSSDSKKVKQGKISDLLNSVDLCQYIRTGPKSSCLSVSELKKKITSEAQLKKILEAFSGNVENAHIYGLKIRSAICYIILSVVLMTPEEFVSKLTEFNK